MLSYHCQKIHVLNRYFGISDICHFFKTTVFLRPRNFTLEKITLGCVVVMVATNFKYIPWLKLQYIRQERNFDIQNVTLKNAQVCKGTPNKLGSVNSHPVKMTLPSPNDATHQSKTHHVMKVGGVNSSGVVRVLRQMVVLYSIFISHKIRNTLFVILVM